MNDNIWALFETAVQDMDNAGHTSFRSTVTLFPWKSTGVMLIENIA